RCSSRGNASPASTTIRSSPTSNTVMFFPTSPRPPRGMIRQVPSTRGVYAPRHLGQSGAAFPAYCLFSGQKEGEYEEEPFPPLARRGSDRRGGRCDDPGRRLFGGRAECVRRPQPRLGRNDRRRTRRLEPRERLGAHVTADLAV